MISFISAAQSVAEQFSAVCLVVFAVDLRMSKTAKCPKRAYKHTRDVIPKLCAADT